MNGEILDRLETLRSQDSTDTIVGKSVDGNLINLDATTDKGLVALQSATSQIGIVIGTDNNDESRLSLTKDTSNISFLFKDNHSFISTQENTSGNNDNHLFDVITTPELGQGVNEVRNIFLQIPGQNYQSSGVFKPRGGIQSTGVATENGFNAYFDEDVYTNGLPSGTTKELLTPNGSYVRIADEVLGVGFILRPKSGKAVVLKSFKLYDQIEEAIAQNVRIFPQMFSVFAKVSSGWIEIYTISDAHLSNKRNGGYTHTIQREGVSSNEFVFLIKEVHIASNDNSTTRPVNIGFIEINVETSTRFLNNVDLEGKSLMNTHRIVADELILNGETYTKMFRDVGDISVTEITNFVREHQFNQMFNPSITNTDGPSVTEEGSKQYLPIVEYNGMKDVGNKDLINVRYDNSVIIDHLLDVSNIKAGSEGIAYIDENHQLKTSFSFETINITDNLDIGNSITLNNSLIEWDSQRDTFNVNKRVAQTEVIDDLYVFPIFYKGYREFEEIVGVNTVTDDSPGNQAGNDIDCVQYGVKTNDGKTNVILQSIVRIYLSDDYLTSGESEYNRELKEDTLHQTTREYLKDKGYYRTRNNKNVFITDTSSTNALFGKVGNKNVYLTRDVRIITVQGNNYNYVDFIEYKLPQEILLKYISYEVRDRSEKVFVTKIGDVTYYPPKKFILVGRNVDSDWEIILDHTVEDEYIMNEPNRFYTKPKRTYSIFRFLIQDIHTLHYTNEQLREHHFEGDPGILVGCEFSDLRIHGTPKSNVSSLNADHMALKEHAKTFQLNDTTVHINNQNIFVSPVDTRLTINSDFNNSNVETASVVHINTNTKDQEQPENILRFGLKRWDGKQDYNNNVIHSAFINGDDRTVYSIDTSHKFDYYKSDFDTRAFNITRYDQGGIVSINKTATPLTPAGLLIHPTLTLADTTKTASIQYQENPSDPKSYTINLPKTIPNAKNKLVVESIDQENVNNPLIETKWDFDPIQTDDIYNLVIPSTSNGDPNPYDMMVVSSVVNDGTGEKTIKLDWIKNHLDLSTDIGYKIELPIIDPSTSIEYPVSYDMMVVSNVVNNETGEKTIKLDWIKNHLDLSTDIGYKIRLPVNEPLVDQKVMQMRSKDTANNTIEMEWVNQDQSIFEDKNIFMGDTAVVDPIYIGSYVGTGTNNSNITHIQNLFVGNPLQNREDLYNRVVNGYDIVSAGKIYASSDIATDSDRRYKDDLEKIEDPYKIIEQLNGYTFTRNDAIEYGERRFTGLIAQEVEAVLPEAIIKKHDGALRVMYGNLAGVFVEALKECKRDITELKREMVKLCLSDPPPSPVIPPPSHH